MKEEQKPRTICTVEVWVEFSKEIAEWGEKSYYENPKFAKFWDNWQTILARKKETKNCYWRVAYLSTKEMAQAEAGTLPQLSVRFLCDLDGMEKINLKPSMHFWLIHHPSDFRTTHNNGMRTLAWLMGECAKYCGGTVRVTYSAKQRYFVYPDDIEVRDIDLGTGIKDMKISAPRMTKRMKRS